MPIHRTLITPFKVIFSSTHVGKSILQTLGLRCKSNSGSRSDKVPSCRSTRDSPQTIPQRGAHGYSIWLTSSSCNSIRVSVYRPVVHVDPTTGKADSPHKKKLRTYLGIVAGQRDIRDLEGSPYCSEGLNLISLKLLTFKSDLTRKWALAADKDSVDDTVCEKYDISKEKWAQFCQTRKDPSWEDVRKKTEVIQKQNTAPHVLSRGGYEYLEQKLMTEKTKKKLEEATQSKSTEGVIDPPSPIRQHVKWKMARTKKTGQMTSEEAKEIAEKIISHFQLRIDSLEEQASQGSFVPHGRQHLLTAAIGRPEHPGRVRAAGATILWIDSMNLPQFFLHGSRRTRAPDSTNQGPTGGVDHKKVTRQMMLSFSQMQSQLQSHVQSQGLALPPELEVGPSATCVSTKGSCVNPSVTDPDTGDSNKSGLYIEENPSRLVALGRVYEGSTAVHNIPLLHGQIKVGVEEVKDAQAPVPVPTNEVILVGQALNTFLSWPTHLVKRLSEQAAIPTKPPDRSDLEVIWDVTVFGVFNEDFPLYIKHEDLSEIAHDGQCYSIFVIQLHLTETSMRAGNSDVYGFLEPLSI
ncbi:hypothetical protein GmHk_09G025921 [Glycine max]|nr:hypothetical protein GmHk_09G025921 [Glycine max]